MKYFTLVQKYPTSPELGTIIFSELSKKAIKHDCLNNPEFWSENEIDITITTNDGFQLNELKTYFIVDIENGNFHKTTTVI